MTDNGNNIEQKPVRKASRWKTLTKLLLTAALIVGALQYVGYYCAYPLLKDRICNGVHKKSQGLYTMDFSDFRIDLLGQKIILDSFSLRADTAVYLQRIEREHYNKAIYNISVESLKINHIGIKSFFSNNELYIKEIMMQSPEIRLVGKPDKSKNEKVKYDAVHTDLYPLLKPYFDALNIRKIVINDGYFDFRLRISDNQEQFGISKIDITLRNFFLNEDKFVKKNQFFYSDVIEIGSRNYVINLADSIHSITAEHLQISTADSSIHASNVMMKSNMRTYTQKNRFDVSLKEIQINGLDISRAYFDKDVNLSKVVIKEPTIKFAKGGRVNRETKKFEGTGENWYPIIKGTLRRIAIDSLEVEGASLSISKPQVSAQPLYNVGNVNIVLEGFELDSLAHHNKNKILYSNDLDVVLNDYRMMLPDNTHQLTADNLMLSTKTEILHADKIKISPTRYVNDSTGKTMRISIPLLELSGIDMRRAYNQKDFNIGTIKISMPDIKTRSFIDSLQANGAPKQRTRLLSALSDEFFHSLKIRNLQIYKGMVDITSKAYIKEDSLTLSGKLSLNIGNFVVNSATLADDILPFRTSSVKISLDDAVVKPSKSPHTLRCKNFKLDTHNDMVKISQFSYTAESDTSLVSTLRRLGKHTIMDIRIDKSEFTKTELLEALYHGKINIESLKISNPQFQMSVYPQLRAHRDSIRQMRLPDSATMHYMDSIMLKFSDMEQLLARRIPKELSLIKVDTLTADSSVFKFVVRDTLDNIVTGTSSDFMFRANGFYFSHDSISPNANIMLANGYMMDINNFHFMLPGKTHIAQCGNIRIDTYDSLIKATDISISPFDRERTQGRAQITAQCPELTITGADFATLNSSGILPISSLTFNNSVATFTKKDTALMPPQNRDTTRRKKIFKGLSIDSLTALNNNFGISNHNGHRVMNVDFDLTSRNVSIDSANLASKGHLISFDSTYLDAQNFRIRIKENEIAAQRIHHENDTLVISDAVFHNPDDSIRTNIKVPYIKAISPNLEELAFSRTLDAKSISIHGTRVNLLSKAKKEKRENQQERERKPFHVKVDTLAADGVCIHLDRRYKDKPDLHFPNMDLIATGINTETEHESVFPADKISAGINNFTYLLRDSVMRFHFGRVELDPIHQVFVANQVDYRPNVGRYDYYKLYDTRRSANYVNCQKMTGYGFNIIDFVKTMKMDLTRVDVDKFAFLSYDNKTMPLDSTRKPTLNEYIFDKLPIRVKSDTTVIRDAFFEMEQLSPEVGTPGVLTLNNINGVVFNFTNDTNDLKANDKMILTASGLLMNQSNVRAKIMYDLDSPTEEFVCNFMADSIYLPTLNPYLENGIFAKVDDGVLTKGTVYFKSDDIKSRGESQFIYHDLKLSLNKKDSIQEKRRGFLSLLANTVVRSKNTRKTGHIYAVPDSTRSFAGYWMQSLLSGLKSTVGSIFESKEQKDDRKLARKLIDAVTRKNRASDYILDIPDYEEVMVE